jgi:hypothetical protein
MYGADLEKMGPPEVVEKIEAKQRDQLLKHFLLGIAAQGGLFPLASQVNGEIPRASHHQLAVQGSCQGNHPFQGKVADLIRGRGQVVYLPPAPGPQYLLEKMPQIDVMETGSKQ